MWIDLAISCGITFVVCGIGYSITEIHRINSLLESIFQEYDKEEVQPLRDKVGVLKNLLENYSEICRRVDQLTQIYREVQSKAKSYKDPLEMIARKREP